MTVAATSSDTRLVPAITVETPLRSRAATRPSGSLPGRSSVRPTSQLDSTTCAGIAGLGATSYP